MLCRQNQPFESASQGDALEGVRPRRLARSVGRRGSQADPPPGGSADVRVPGPIPRTAEVAWVPRTRGRRPREEAEEGPLQPLLDSGQEQEEADSQLWGGRTRPPGQREFCSLDSFITRWPDFVLSVLSTHRIELIGYCGLRLVHYFILYLFYSQTEASAHPWSQGPDLIRLRSLDTLLLPPDRPSLHHPNLLPHPRVRLHPPGLPSYTLLRIFKSHTHASVVRYCSTFTGVIRLCFVLFSLRIICALHYLHFPDFDRFFLRKE